MVKKLVQINSVCNGSTGKIMHEIQKEANNFGFDTISFYGRKKPFSDLPCSKFEYKIEVAFHALITFIFNKHGHGSYFASKRLIKKIKKINPDIIQIHNIHGYYLNYKVLINYLKNEFQGKVYWTLHDCILFTGHCAYYTYVDCEKWKNQCYSCPQYKNYPYSWFFDNSKREFSFKKNLFNNIPNLTFITPSKWLKDEVKQSFLKKYKTIVINNGIDLNVFKKTKDKEIFDKYNIPNNKKIILGVASVWEKRKGLDSFIKLAKEIDSNTTIVLVGLNNKQINSLPSNIIGISRTDNQKDLACIYSIADIFLNPTLEDNYPTTNIEAIACGTPIITFKTGGCSEQVFPNTGYYVKDYEEMLIKINYCLKVGYKNKIFDNSACLSKIDSKIKFKEYVSNYINEREK